MLLKVLRKVLYPPFDIVKVDGTEHSINGPKDNQIGDIKRAQILVQKFRNRVEDFVDEVIGNSPWTTQLSPRSPPLVERYRDQQERDSIIFYLSHYFR